jgi:hypothetical protein
MKKKVQNKFSYVKAIKKIKRLCCMQNTDVLRHELHGALFGRFYYR